MQKRSQRRPQIRVARLRHDHHRWLPGLIAVLAAAMAAGLGAPRADAALHPGEVYSSRIEDARWVERYAAALQRTGADNSLRRRELPEEDYSTFSGVGVIACSVGGVTRSSTAFLVGAFDLAVTVAHTFRKGADGAEPECFYNSMDSRGQVRERIPIAYVRSQWEETGAVGEISKDLAVARLSQPSRYAQRTMPLGRFSGAQAPVVMVGFSADVYADTVKRKAQGAVYPRRPDEEAALQGFVHDMDARGIAAGAPVMDERSGVIIGIHLPLDSRRNTMIPMDDWLEQTLRAEIQLAERAEAKVN